MQKNKNIINFFYDSKKFNRDWYLDSNKSAKSGSDNAFCWLIIYLSNFFKINLYCTKIPKNNIQKNISFKIVSSILEVEKKIKSNEFLIFNHSNDLQYQKLLLDKKNNSKKYIIWMHNTPSYEWLSKIENSKSIFRLIAVSDTQRLGLSHTKVFKKIVTIPHFVEAKVKFKKNFKKKNQILYIGALVSTKGFHLLAEIWPSVYSKHPDWKLKVLGSINLYSKLSKIKNSGLYEYENNLLSYIGGSYQKAKKYGVSFEGSVPKNKLLLEILESEFVIVNPNYKNSFETFCISAAEGLLLGKPILGGNKGSLPEVVKHNVGGLLHNNKDEFKKNLLNMIENKNLRYELGKKGKKNYISYFNNDAVKKKWKNLLINKKIKNYYRLDVYKNQIFQFVLRSVIRYSPNKIVLFIKKLKK